MLCELLSYLTDTTHTWRNSLVCKRWRGMFSFFFPTATRNSLGVSDVYRTTTFQCATLEVGLVCCDQGAFLHTNEEDGLRYTWKTDRNDEISLPAFANYYANQKFRFICSGSFYTWKNEDVFDRRLNTFAEYYAKRKFHLIINYAWYLDEVPQGMLVWLASMIRHCDSIEWNFVHRDDALNPKTRSAVEEGFRTLTTSSPEPHSIRHVTFCGFLINWVVTPPFDNLESCEVVHLCAETRLSLLPDVYTRVTTLQYDVAQVCSVKNIACFVSIRFAAGRSFGFASI